MQITREIIIAQKAVLVVARRRVMGRLSELWDIYTGMEKDGADDVQKTVEAAKIKLELISTFEAAEKMGAQLDAVDQVTLEKIRNAKMRGVIDLSSENINRKTVIFDSISKTEILINSCYDRVKDAIGKWMDEQLKTLGGEEKDWSKIEPVSVLWASAMKWLQTEGVKELERVRAELGDEWGPENELQYKTLKKSFSDGDGGILDLILHARNQLNQVSGHDLGINFTAPTEHTMEQNAQIDKNLKSLTEYYHAEVAKSNDPEPLNIAPKAEVVAEAVMTQLNKRNENNANIENDPEPQYNILHAKLDKRQKPQYNILQAKLDKRQNKITNIENDPESPNIVPKAEVVAEAVMIQPKIVPADNNSSNMQSVQQSFAGIDKGFAELHTIKQQLSDELHKPTDRLQKFLWGLCNKDKAKDLKLLVKLSESLEAMEKIWKQVNGYGAADLSVEALERLRDELEMMLSMDEGSPLHEMKQLAERSSICDPEQLMSEFTMTVGGMLKVFSKKIKNIHDNEQADNFGLGIPT